MEAIIELKDIKKAYGQTEVLNHFNLSIDQGEFITIIGTSGSGKTTVLKMINGLIQPTSGHVKVHGQDIQEQTKYCLCFTIRKENKKYGSNRRSMVRNSTIRYKL